MTLCAGWICGDAAFLVVDSAVTIVGNTVAERFAADKTTFGETEVSQPGKVVLEGAAKLFRLHDTAIAAFAGDPDAALPVLRSIHYSMIAGADVRTAMAREQSRIKGFLLGIAGLEHGAPRLWCCANGAIDEKYVPNQVWVWGPAPGTELSRKVQELVGRVAVSDPDLFLARAVGATQVALVASGTFAEGVGGACFGAYVTRNGITTSGDSAFVICTPAPGEPPFTMHRIVACGWRYGAQYSQAFIRNEHTGIFGMQTTVFDSEEPFAHRPTLERALASLDTEFPVPTYATFVDAQTSSTIFVPLLDRPDLLQIQVRERDIECRVYSSLMLIMDDLLRALHPGQSAMLWVTRTQPPPGERVLIEKSPQGPVVRKH